MLCRTHGFDLFLHVLLCEVRDVYAFAPFVIAVSRRCDTPRSHDLTSARALQASSSRSARPNVQSLFEFTASGVAILAWPKVLRRFRLAAFDLTIAATLHGSVAMSADQMRASPNQPTDRYALEPEMTANT